MKITDETRNKIIDGIREALIACQQFDAASEIAIGVKTRQNLDVNNLGLIRWALAASQTAAVMRPVLSVDQLSEEASEGDEARTINNGWTR